MSVQEQTKWWRKMRYPAFTWNAAAWALAVILAVIGAMTALLLAVFAAVGAVMVTGGTIVYRRYFRSAPKKSLERRRQLELREGWATQLDLLRAMGAWRLRKNAHVLRPSMSGMSRRERRALPPQQLGVQLISVTGWAGKQPLYASCERSLAMFGAAGTGKTAYMGHVLLDVPEGIPVLATSSKTDLAYQTKPIRTEVGPVWVFNPQRIGGEEYASTFRWNPLVGCKDPETAQIRAGYLIAGSGQAGSLGDAGFWRGQGVRILSVYLHAAALGGLTMMRVYEWIAEATQSKRMSTELLELLEGSPSKRAMLSNLKQWLGTNDKTASSTTTMITHAVQWLSTSAAELADCKPDEGFDVEEWLSGGGTLYLIGEAREFGSIAPYFSTFVGWLLDAAKARAATMPQGRNDPQVLLLLDELANLCPLPQLDQLLATMRGMNIGAVLGFQSPAQVVQVWGEHAAQVIMDNLWAELYAGGYTNPDLLERLSLLVGGALKTDEIKDLPDREVLMLANGVAGAVTGELRRYWDRADHKALEKAREEALRGPGFVAGLMDRFRRPAVEAATVRGELTAEPAPLPTESVAVPEQRIEPDAADHYDMSALIARENWTSSPDHSADDEGDGGTVEEEENRER